MRKTLLTPENIAFIKANRLEMSGKQMALRFGVSKSVVNNYMRKNGLSVPRELKNRFMSDALCKVSTSNKKIDQMLQQNYLFYGEKPIARMIGRSSTFVRTRLRQLGLKVPDNIVELRKMQSRFSRGHTPQNKGKKMPESVRERIKHTFFLPGNVPVNAKQKDGEIVIRYDHKNRGGQPYMWIRIALGVWKPYHKHLWNEKHGSIPDSHCLWFKDGNTLNCTLENLELISRSENLKRNREFHAALPEELKEAIRLIKKINQKTTKKHRNEKQTLRPEQSPI